MRKTMTFLGSLLLAGAALLGACSPQETPPTTQEEGQTTRLKSGRYDYYCWGCRFADQQKRN